jgi:hypothetical protein
LCFLIPTLRWYLAKFISHDRKDRTWHKAPLQEPTGQDDDKEKEEGEKEGSGKAATEEEEEDHESEQRTNAANNREQQHRPERQAGEGEGEGEEGAEGDVGEGGVGTEGDVAEGEVGAEGDDGEGEEGAESYAAEGAARPPGQQASKAQEQQQPQQDGGTRKKDSAAVEEVRAKQKAKQQHREEDEMRSNAAHFFLKLEKIGWGALDVEAEGGMNAAHARSIQSSVAALLRTVAWRNQGQKKAWTWTQRTGNGAPGSHFASAEEAAIFLLLKYGSAKNAYNYVKTRPDPQAESPKAEINTTLRQWGM